EENLEKYYKFPGESYITYESEEDFVEAKISVISMATTTSSESNNSINNDKDVSQHKASKSQHYSQENQLLNAQEGSCNTQENQSYNIQKN
ncbi:26239_t:CDS:2, partial [Gigaspora rosea]